MSDLTQRAYADLVDACRATGRAIGGVEDALEDRLTPDPSIIIRHDVDRRPAHSVAMAQLEAERGVHVSYYFRACPRFPVDAIRAIHDLGHHVGYHYETLVEARGDSARARDLFRRRVDELRSIAECRTVCRHGSPLSRFDSLTVVDDDLLQELDLLGDAVLSLVDRPLAYLTDTGGRWTTSLGGANVRDAQPNAVPMDPPASTANLARRVADLPHNLYLNAHPERWSRNAVDHLYCRSLDLGVNAAKRIVRALRRG